MTSQKLTLITVTALAVIILNTPNAHAQRRGGNRGKTAVQNSHYRTAAQPRLGNRTPNRANTPRRHSTKAYRTPRTPVTIQPAQRPNRKLQTGNNIVIGNVNFSNYKGGAAVRGPRNHMNASRPAIGSAHHRVRHHGIIVRDHVGIRFPNHQAWFGNRWYLRHPNAWRALIWGRPIWIAPTYQETTNWLMITDESDTAEPTAIHYEFGTTITYQDGAVFRNKEQIATADEFYQQAVAIAQAGDEAAADDQWHSFGVFAIARGNQTDSEKIVQLAVNKTGTVRGNYYDALTESTLPIQGSVDKESQRVAWTIGENENVVYQTGLVDLTKDESTMLIHFGKDKTQQSYLIRLEQPANQ